MEWEAACAGAYGGGTRGAQFPGRQVTIGGQITAVNVEKSQQCHKYFFQYSKSASETPQFRTWGAKFASCPGRHLTSLRPVLVCVNFVNLTFVKIFLLVLKVFSLRLSNKKNVGLDWAFLVKMLITTDLGNARPRESYVERISIRLHLLLDFASALLGFAQVACE